MTFTDELLAQIRGQFPALRRSVNGESAAFFDGPGGTQVPQRVIDAVSNYLAHANANHAGLFATSVESDAILDAAHQAVADFLGAEDPQTVYFGQNMTSLTFALSRAISRRWQKGDEVLVTLLDHDANVSPWVLAARDAGATVKFVSIRTDDCTLDLDDFHNKLSPRTRLVAVGCASNAIGTVNPVRTICETARAVGAWTFLDAVHYAPHRLIDVHEFGCDFLACSAYKFFGPHVGIVWGRQERLEELTAYKVRPCSNELPAKWMTGTQNHEGIAGTREAIEYLADLGRRLSPRTTGRRDALRAAMAGITEHENALAQQLIGGLLELPRIRIRGITDRTRMNERLPTLAITHESLTSAQLAAVLGERGFFTWHGNYYALGLTETLGLEPHGMLRIGLVHYNTAEEVNRLLTALREIA